MDKIVLKDAEFSAYIGVLASEREKKQKITLELELFLDLKAAGVNDDLKQTVNYLQAYLLLNRMFTEKQFKLIEGAAQSAAQLLLQNFPLTKVTIRLKKFEGFKFAAYAGVEITRERENG